MKRNVILMFLVSLMIAGLSGCIISHTPNTPTVTLNVPTSQTFSVMGFMNGPYTWSWDKGSGFVTIPGASSGPSYTYTADCADVGTFVIKVQTHCLITNQLWVAQWIVTVVDIPVAEAGPGQSIVCGQLATLDGSASYDLCGCPLTYEWTIVSAPAGSYAVLSNPAIVNPTFTPDICGTYEIALIVYCGGTPSVPDTMTLVVTCVAVPAATSCADVAAAGLVCSTSTHCSNTDPAGTVMSQSPAPGTMVCPGSTVQLVISTGPCTI